MDDLMAKMEQLMAGTIVMSDDKLREEFKRAASVLQDLSSETLKAAQGNRIAQRRKAAEKLQKWAYQVYQLGTSI